MCDRESHAGGAVKSASPDKTRALIELLDNTLGLLCGCDVCKAGEGTPIPYEEAFREMLFVEWASVSDDAKDVAIATLLSGGGELSEAEIETILAALGNDISVNMTNRTATQMPKLFDDSYRLAKTTAIARFDALFSWNQIDSAAVDWLTKHHVYWIGNYYDRFLSQALADKVAEGMAAGLGREDIGQTLKTFFSDYEGVPVRPQTYWDGLAANGMNRSRNFGSISGYEDVGVTQFMIAAVLDNRTSEICRDMDGRIIDLGYATDQRDAMMAASDPEAVKTIAPWPKLSDIAGKSTQEVVDQGVILPPYHFRCRTGIVEVA